MQQDLFETWNTFTQQTLESWKKLGETNLRLGEKLLKEQVDLTTELVEAATAHAQEVSSTKDVKDLAALQAEFVQDYNKRWMEASRSWADVLAEAGKVYNQVFEAGVKTAGDNMAAAKPAAKAKKAA